MQVQKVDDSDDLTTPYIYIYDEIMHTMLKLLSNVSSTEWLPGEGYHEATNI